MKLAKANHTAPTSSSGDCSDADPDRPSKVRVRIRTLGPRHIGLRPIVESIENHTIATCSYPERFFCSHPRSQ
jgi:hypothetical protein